MIVHVITGLNRGGAEHALYRLLTQEPDPSRVRVVSLSDGGLFQSRLEALGVSVTCLHLRPLFPSPLKWWRLVGLLKKWRPRVVQTWMYHADLLGGLAARAAGVPACWGIRNSGLSPRRSKWSTRLVATICAQISSKVPARAISCSARAAETHRKLGYAVPFEIVPNGLDVSAWAPNPEQRSAARESLGYGERDFVFAHAARDDPQKDHGGLALAFNQLHAATPQVRLLMCGKGLVAGSGYFDKLPFTSEARAAVLALGPRDDLPWLWQAADAFVLSSSFGEAFPNVVVEAMASGLPCVVTDVGDAADIVGATGYVVPPGDPAALSIAMRNITDLPAEERERRGRAARERVQARFTLPKMAEGFRRVWDAVIEENTRRCAE